MQDIMKPDQIYASKKSKVAPFKFDQEVADVFEDMINRSVPGYQSIVQMMGALGLEYIQAGTHVYDLGCSLGALSFTLAENKDIPPCHIHAVDMSAPMIQKCVRRLTQKKASEKFLHPITFECKDIRNLSLKSSSLILLNFVLQFIKSEQRNTILSHCFNSLRPGGALVVSEKIYFEDPQQREKMQALHHRFKQAQGYSNLEISQKRNAIENILIPDELTQLKTRLSNAGFNQIYPWLQCFNFVSFLAVK